MKTNLGKILAAVLFVTGCAPSGVVMNDREFAGHSAIDFENVRFRRPTTPVYDPDGPAAPVAKELGNLDCERSEDFFGRLNLAAMRACLNQFGPAKRGGSLKAFDLEWNLRKDGQPTLELRNPDDAPGCFRTALAQLPFPRELVYVIASEVPMRGECYTSRLALEDGNLLGWELPRSKTRLRVSFPLREVLKTDRDVERTLRTWILSVYRGGAGAEAGFRGRFLPNQYCVRCLGLPDDLDRAAAKVPAPASIWPSPATGDWVR